MTTLNENQQAAIIQAIEEGYAHHGLKPIRPIRIEDIHLGATAGDITQFTLIDPMCVITGTVNRLGGVSDVATTLACWQSCHAENTAYVNTDYAYEIYKDESVK